MKNWGFVVYSMALKSFVLMPIYMTKKRFGLIAIVAAVKLLILAIARSITFNLFAELALAGKQNVN
jgi:hypothetical protein